MKKFSLKIGIPILLLLISVKSFSQETSVNTKDLTHETMKNVSEGKQIKLIWWIPIEFWKATFAEDRDMSESQIKEFLEFYKPYTLFAVVEGKVGSMGGFTFVSADSIRKYISLVDDEKNIYKPVDEDKMSPDLKNLLSIFVPILKNFIGQLGENMQFYVFTDIDLKGKRISDPYSKGFVQLNIGKDEYKWKTPLCSLLPPKICPADGESMNGAWEYCLWHGVKLFESKK
jgi:hypothetical protein